MVGACRDSEQTDQWEKFVGTFNSLDYDNGSREYKFWKVGLFSTFVHRGGLHRRKSSACPKFEMFWLYRSPVQWEGGG
jgi:hypothetical protein